MAYANGLTVDRIAKQRVAFEMSQRTGNPIKADMVIAVSRNPGMSIFAAQYENITILCEVCDNKITVKAVGW